MLNVKVTDYSTLSVCSVNIITLVGVETALTKI